MAKSIQDLRRERGFRSSREFADALGVSPSSMSRYDKDPTLIPVKVAWAMADLLECSIDEVLGREHVTSGKSSLQEDYDALSPETQALVSEFMEFAKSRDGRARDDAQAEQDLKFDRLCQFYERMFYQSLHEEAEFGDPVIFVSSAHEREAFEDFVEQKAAEKREKRIADRCSDYEASLEEGYEVDGYPMPYGADAIRSFVFEYKTELERDLEDKDGKVIGAIMVAYDRLHSDSTHVYDSPRIAVEYMGGPQQR